MQRSAIPVTAAFILLFVRCQSPAAPPPQAPAPAPVAQQAPPVQKAPQPVAVYRLNREVAIKNYFRFLDDLVRQYDSLTPYDLTEHLLVRANPWLIDSLEETDYYRLKAKGIFVYNQRGMTILHPGDSLLIPDTALAAQLQSRINNTWIDINIPEYKLRIVEGADTLFTFPVRVGQHKKRYQKVIERVADLRTLPGAGKIIRISRETSWFEDPHTGRRITETKRDDKKKTLMPMIPWLEPEINGIRLGQLIHPTTNPKTLGKASSNGCIGLREADAWRVYYYAPVGTRVIIRYDLQVPQLAGDTLVLPDIYGWDTKKHKPKR